MSRWFVSRHPGAIAWAQSQHLRVDRWVPHLDVADVRDGDVVMGTLPVHLAQQVCARGAAFYFLSVEILASQRGQELSRDEMMAANCSLVKYVVLLAD
jgi:CRISPR-associated protein Csx16